jgi:hypothetical protein
MSILNKTGEAWMLRAEGDRLLANVLADRMAAWVEPVARSAGKFLRLAWYLTTRETSYHLQPKPTRHAGH